MTAKSTANSASVETSLTTIGIDIGKNTFHVIGLNARGAIILRLKLSRSQLQTRFANLPPCLIGMEACVGSHHLARCLRALGHDARLMPARYVRPLSRGQKNDFNDALACAEAVLRPTMKFVAIKTVEQLDLQALHRIRERLVSQRTGVTNQIRAFLLERGIAVRTGLRFLRADLPDILAKRTDALSPHMLRLIEDLATDWRRLDARIDTLTAEIETIARNDAHCTRTMSVPGVGPIISSATVAAIGTGDVFSKGRDFAAWLGLVPKQFSTGDRTVLGKISRQGNCYLRKLFVQAAWVVLVKPASGDAARSQGLDRGGQETAAPQRAGDRAGQQTRPHHLGRTGQGPRFRSDETKRCRAPGCLSLAPCSVPSRRGLETAAIGMREQRRPALTEPTRVAPRALQAGTKEGPCRRTKELRS